jgi:hypothetical protein
MALAVAMLFSYSVSLIWAIPELIHQRKKLKIIPGRKGA